MYIINIPGSLKVILLMLYTCLHTHMHRCACVCVCVCVCRGTEIVIGSDQIIIIFIVPVVKRKEVIIKVYKFYKVNY